MIASSVTICFFIYPIHTRTITVLHRGMAFFLPDDHPGAEILVPVWISGKKMSFLAFQVKNRKGDSYSAELREETRSSFLMASEASGFNAPFIGLAMTLRHGDHGKGN